MIPVLARRCGLLATLCCLATPSWAQTSSVYVPAADGTRLALDLYLPDDLDAGERVPALVELTRYWRSAEHPETGKRRGSPGRLDRSFLAAGYALLKVDVRGSGASFGNRQIEYGPEEVLDGAAILDWIVAQPWSSGAVGAYGTSYTGTTAELLAATKHPALRAVIPGWSDFDVYRSPGRPYGVVADALIRTWGELVGWLDANDVTALQASVRRVDEDTDGELLRAAVAEHAKNPDVYTAMCALEYRDTPMGAGPHSLADASSLHWKEEIEASGVPMLVFASWLDAGTAGGALQRLQTYSNPQKLVVLASSHGGLTHASPYVVGKKWVDPQPSMREMGDLRLAFFDHHLKGLENEVESWPTVRYFNMGEEAFHTTDVWPPAGVATRRYFLREDRGLSPDPPTAAEAADEYAVDFEVSTGSKNRWMTQMGEPVLGLDDRGAMDERMLCYTTTPLAEDLQLTGTPVVRLQVSSDATDGLFLVYLEDVDPEGRSRYLTEGGLRALHRAPHAGPDCEPGVPCHSFAKEDAQPLAPGERTELAFRLWPLSARIARGHRLRLAIAGADEGTFARLPERESPTIRVHRGAVAGSFLELPVAE